MQVGEIISWHRTFTEDDVRRFSHVSGDAGAHHVRPDALGRLMVQGLLTATLPTKIGGDLNFIAREMTFRFHRPVFVGDTVQCDVTITALEPAEQTTRMSAQWVCRNQDGHEVMTGQAHGVIRDTGGI
ncbi:MAG: MaoC family dehydratase N-terminal domain-containing protein [Roseiflexaceae bacterium]